MTDADMLMEYQLALADLAAAQRKIFAVNALHSPTGGSAFRCCKTCRTEWPCETRQAMGA